MRHARALMILAPDAARMTYGPDEVRDIARHVELLAPPMTPDEARAQPDLLGLMDVLFSGWGGPRVDRAFLNAAPRLTAVFYGGGSLSSVLTDAVWARGIRVTSAIAANAVPVAEYTLATILFSLKHGWRLARETRERRVYPDRNAAPGCYRRTVGLISLGAVARALLPLLRPFDLDVLVCDPFLESQEAQALGVIAVTLEELFERSDVVSVHAPCLPETAGLITGRHVGSMKFGATFINTARGEVVREREMLDVLAHRPDLQAVLDTVVEEPPRRDSPLYTLPNVVLTPHIAGSVGQECRRMGRYMVEELERYVTGRPLRWAVTPESIHHTSHRPSLPASAPVPPPVTAMHEMPLPPSLLPPSLHVRPDAVLP